ncbi:Crp/Fnr family transcriptional regulator [Ideonella sp. BN130291]|uniref:Crp/Fnr family transcriptional regulator n=1 Tax=Ideonella sp. BN130291 TaxID=3112940 RepID=UPI002E252992|nr:Crp/Fnr family transcriptional regulator [Ideonella sp. BN130291]
MAATPRPAEGRNTLIDALAARDRARLLAACRPMELVADAVLCKPREPLHEAVFPTSGAISLLTDAALGPSFEVGLIGREGMLAVELALGLQAATLQAVVRVAGQAYRVPVVALRRELASSAGLRRVMAGYLQAQLSQLAGEPACVRFHSVVARLARSLLLVQDRLHSEHFHLTQDSLARTLAVRRVSVTNAASALQREGIIRYRRGDITVTDRPALRAWACGCYSGGDAGPGAKAR